MGYAEDKKLHETINFVGLRAQATTVGLLQLVRELRQLNVLADDAVGRIKAAIVADLALSRPRSTPPEQYESEIRERIDHLFDGSEPTGPVRGGRADA